MSETNTQIEKVKSEIKKEEKQPSIEYIYSRVVPRGHPQSLIHIIVRKERFNEISDRENIIPAPYFLQVGYMKLNANQTFRAHKHVPKEFFGQKYVNESWEVVKGSFEFQMYDLDDSKLETRILKEGDISITVGLAGHNYTALEDNTLIREWKSGPHFGSGKDKKFI